jgi:hypothetical protein
MEKQGIFTSRIFFAAELFTMGCGEIGQLSSPIMNNVGPPIRVARNELPWD